MDHERAIALDKAVHDSNVAKPSPSFSGTWRNQMGSTVSFAVTGRAVSGQYTSASSSGGPPVSSVDLTGFVDGDLLSFIVIWPGGSMTSWVGQLVDRDGAACIKTLWHLLTDIPDANEPTFLWKSTLAGSDEFFRP